MVNLPGQQFSVPFSASGFPPATVGVLSPLSFEPRELAHALFVTGRAPGDQVAFGMASVWEFVHRASLIPSYVRMADDGRLVRSRLAIELDRSEKVALSYALGQAMTSVFCRRALGVSYLMHVDRYGQRFGVTFGATGNRPDLIGRTATGWVVAEAKGRSNAMEADLRGKLEDQKRAVATVEGQPPAVTLGCVASFPPKQISMTLDVFDPVEDGPESVQLDIGFERFLLAYYEPFVAAVDAGDRLDSDDDLVVSSLGAVGLRVGLSTQICDAVKSSQSDADGLNAVVGSALSDIADDRQADGTIVEVDWADPLSLRDWDEEPDG